MSTTTDEVWREELAGAFGRLRTHQSAVELAGAIHASSLGRASAFLVSGTPQIVSRTPASIREEPGDPLKLCIQRSGRAIVRQLGAETVLHPGDLTLYDTGRPYDIRLDGQWECAVLTLPREALRASDHNISLHTLCKATSGTGLVLDRLISSCFESRTGCADRLGEAGIHLVASLLTSAAPAADPSAGLKERILAHVRAHLGDPGLGHASVAAAHGMSVRTLHRLFEGEASIADTIRELRLQAVRDDLLNPALSRRTVMAIASRWGFLDQAHLTRAFRARFGQTPARVRAARD